MDLSSPAGRVRTRLRRRAEGDDGAGERAALERSPAAFPTCIAKRYCAAGVPRPLGVASERLEVREDTVLVGYARDPLLRNRVIGRIQLSAKVVAAGFLRDDGDRPRTHVRIEDDVPGLGRRKDDASDQVLRELARSGQYVKPGYAKKHPGTTVKESK